MQFITKKDAITPYHSKDKVSINQSEIQKEETFPSKEISTKIEQKNTVPLELTDFIHLLLITLAKNSKYYDFKNPTIKYACLPANYKEIINQILSERNGWHEKFSVLIDIEEYDKDHLKWEEKMSLTFKKILKDLGKTIEYNLEYDRLIIPFKTIELLKQMEKYNDEKINDIMEHFTNLLTSYVYTREYKEKFLNAKEVIAIPKKKIKKNS